MFLGPHRLKQVNKNSQENKQIDTEDHAKNANPSYPPGSIAASTQFHTAPLAAVDPLVCQGKHTGFWIPPLQIKNHHPVSSRSIGPYIYCTCNANAC